MPTITGGVVALLCLVGCVGVDVQPNTVLPESPHTSNATLVVAEITHPRDLTVSAPFYVAMQRELPVQIAKAHVAERVTAERDLGPIGVGGPAFALRYRVTEDTVIVTNTGTTCTMGLIIPGCITIVPLFFLGLCTKTARHSLTIEARVFDVKGLPVSKIRDSNSNDMLNVYDTSTLSPILQKEYSLKVDVSNGVFHHYEGEEAIAVDKQEAAEAVRQTLAQSLDDVSRALQGQ